MVGAWKREFREHLFSVLGRFPGTATTNDKYLALAYTVRAHLLGRWARTSQFYQKKRARTVCYLSAEFLLGPQPRQQPRQPRRLQRRQEGDGRARHRFPGPARTGAGARPRQWRPRPPRRLLSRFARDPADSRHRPRHPLRIRHVRPADPRRLADRAARQMAAAGQSVGDPPARDRLRCGLRRPHRGLHGRRGPFPRPLDSGPHRAWRRLRHANPRLSGQHHQHAAAVERRGGQFLRPRLVQHRRLSRRRHGEGWRRRPSPRCSIPTTTQPKGKQLRLEQQYFLVACALQDMVRIHLQTATDPHPLPRQIRPAAQRHPSGTRRRRIDAHPGRRERHGMGRGLGGDPPDHRLHQPYAPAGSPGEMAGRDVRQPAAAAPGDRLRDQSPVPRRGVAAIPGRRRSHAPARPDRRDGRTFGAHGPPRLCGQPRRQRRRRAAQRAFEARRPQGFPRAVAAEVLQCDQRRDARAASSS